MIGLTFIIGDLDLSDKISTYSVRKVMQVGEVLTSISGTEYAFYGETQTEVEASFFPMTEQETTAFYDAVRNGKFKLTYTDTYDNGRTATRNFRMISNPESVFMLMSVDGKRRYSGSTVQMRTSQ